MKDVTSVSLDAWFVLCEVARASDNSIVLRGSTKNHGIPVALKCHAMMSNDARQMVAQEPLTYEILVYDHAVTAVSGTDFFVSSLGTIRRQWYFEESTVSTEGLGPADTALSLDAEVHLPVDRRAQRRGHHLGHARSRSHERLAAPHTKTSLLTVVPRRVRRADHQRFGRDGGSRHRARRFTVGEHSLSEGRGGHLL